MHAPIDGKIVNYLTDHLKLPWHSTGAVVQRMRTLARVAGYDLDERFAAAGLGAGPDARMAAAIVSYAIKGTGGAATEYDMKNWAQRSVRTLAPRGRR